MLISLIMQIAQSMQISIRHFLTPQTIYVTFPLKNLAVKNISGLVCLASGLPCYRADGIKVDVSSVIEHFAILMLDRTSASISVHETRKLLFMRKGCIMAVLTSPETALQQHIKNSTTTREL